MSSGGRECDAETASNGATMRYKADGALGARDVYLSSTDPRSARCDGDMLAWSCMERDCGLQRP